MTTKKTVVVAMSGGVDSSLTAALLKEQGDDVIGITMQIWPSDQLDEKHGGCCSLSAANDARRVADLLDIPFYVMNFREEFADKVISPFAAEYLKGRTPNPCIVCNAEIKFKSLLQKALSLGADYLATGHYAIVEYDKNTDRYLLKKAKDQTKDQTYALYNLTQEQLKHILFPLGPYTKRETRAMAAKRGMAVADKPDSQEICFVPDDYQGFLKNYCPRKIHPGPFVDKEGNILGTHKGIPFYTIGQRKGLGLSLGKPAYVIDIDARRNIVVVGDEADVFGNALLAVDCNFIPFETLAEPLQVTAKVRYSAPEAEATLLPKDASTVEIRFARHQRAITPGQAVVFYHGDQVVGGGTIEKKIE